MVYISILLGALVGGVLAGFRGVLLGAGLGYGAWGLATVGRRLSSLEREVDALRRQLGRTAADAAPALTGIPPDTADAAESSPSPMTPEGDAGFIFETPPPPAGGDVPLEQPPPIPAAGTWREAREGSEGWIPDALRRFLSGGSLLVKTGIVILFIGVSFLVKYAAEHDLLPIELRLSGAALGGVVLLSLGWRLRLSRPNYAHVLQGGGVGILYLTTFAAFRLYELIPAPFAFSILVATAAVSSTLAVLQDSRSLAVLGVSGGFLAPILTSTGEGSHVVLFSYYALLNLGIAGIAWFRAWRILNLLGFAFTFVIGLSWGWRYYRPEYFPTTEPFLIIFFLIYTFIALLFALRQPPELKGYLDGTLVFGTPIVAFSLQGALVEPYLYGLAWSAVALGLFYLPLAWILFRQRPRYMRTLTEAFFAFGIIFGTLALPLALENRWTSAAWALEGAAVLWAGIRQKRRLARIFGVLLQIGAGVFFLADLDAVGGPTPVLNGFFLGCALIGITGSFSAFCLRRHRDGLMQWEPAIGHLLLAWGLLWWFSGGIGEILRQADAEYRMGYVLLFLALSCGLCDLLEKRLAWRSLAFPSLGLLPMLFLCALAQIAEGAHPLAGGGVFGWPAAFLVYCLILYRHEESAHQLLPLLHSGTLWLVALACTREACWRIDDWIAGSSTWPLVTAGLMPAVLLLLLFRACQRLSWPFARHREAYLGLGAAPLALFSGLWIWYANAVSSGDPAPLRYLPVVNPLDLTVGVVFLALALWTRRLRDVFHQAAEPLPRNLLAAAAAATLFFSLNGMLVRTVHHWAGIPFTLPALYHSLLLQASLSLFWSLLALLTMVFATAKGMRTVWLTGAALLGLVVLKLFLVDLSGTGTVARIVSFVGVGILILVIGYFAPVPPHTRREVKP